MQYMQPVSDVLITCIITLYNAIFALQDLHIYIIYVQT